MPKNAYFSEVENRHSLLI